MDNVFSNFDLVLKAFLVTLELFVVSGVLSLILGTVIAAFRVGPVPVLARAAAFYVALVRNTPLLVIFIVVTTMLPNMGWNLPGISIGSLNVSNYFVKGIIALTVYTAAFVCEAMRSGINSVSMGQAEASRAIGMTFAQSMREVILPQALRAALPPVASVQIALVKNTSVAAVFGLFEATARMRFFTNNNADARTWIFLTFALGYIIIVELVSFGSHRLERRWKVVR